MRHFLKEKNSKNSSFFFKKSLMRFLSLRYSADFRRSRLVFYLKNQIIFGILLCWSASASCSIARFPRTGVRVALTKTLSSQSSLSSSLKTNSTPGLEEKRLNRCQYLSTSFTRHHVNDESQVFDLCESVQICMIFSAGFCKDRCTES